MGIFPCEKTEVVDVTKKKLKRLLCCGKKDERAWEKERGLVSRKELRNHVLGMFDELNVMEFHAFYMQLWRTTATNSLLKISADKIKKLEEEIKELKKEAKKK